MSKPPERGSGGRALAAPGAHGWTELARAWRALAAALDTHARVVAVVEAPFEATITAGVDLGDLDRATGADGDADERRAVMVGAVLAATGAAAGVGVQVKARLAAGLDVQVLGDAAGDVGRPAPRTPAREPTAPGN